MVEKDAISKVVSELVNAAIQQDQAIMRGEGGQARKYGKILVNRWDRIVGIGDDAKERLAQHLHDENPSVRGAVAALLLKYRHQEAMSVLGELAQGQGLVALCAEESIERWEEGTWALE